MAAAAVERAARSPEAARRRAAVAKECINHLLVLTTAFPLLYARAVFCSWGRRAS